MGNWTGGKMRCITFVLVRGVTGHDGEWVIERPCGCFWLIPFVFGLFRYTPQSLMFCCDCMHVHCVAVMENCFFGIQSPLFFFHMVCLLGFSVTLAVYRHAH